MSSTRNSHSLERSRLPVKRKVLSVFGASLLSAGSVHAQESTGQDQINELDKIQVTAQKRQQSELEVPISMTVINTEELEAMRVSKIDDFILTIPNVTFIDYGSFSPVVTIRGITSTIGGQFDPIGVTLDGISYGTTETEVINSARFFDLEQVEVLRGPQGTLGGTNTTGGSINYTSIAPDPSHFELRGMVDYSSYDTRKLKVSANLPLSPEMALRTVVYSEHTEGAVKNLGPGGGSSGQNNVGGRVAFLWKPTDALTINASYAAEDQHRGMDNFMYSTQVYGDPGAVDAKAAAADMGITYDDPRITYIQNRGNNRGYVLEDVRDHHDIQNNLGSLKVDYDTDDYNFEFLYGYLHHRHEGLVDADKTEIARRYNHYLRWDTSNSVELKASSHYDGPINWIAGLLWHKEDNPYELSSYRGDDEVGGKYSLQYRWANDQILTSKALYTSVFWDIAPRLHLQVGARYNESKSEYGETDYEYDATAPMPKVSGWWTKLHAFSPRLTFNYDLSKDVTTYFQYATGFRDGYSNGQAAGYHVTSKGEFEVPSKVDPEKVENYEIGLKGLFFDRILELTAAAFYLDYRDMQIYGGFVEDPSNPDENPTFDLNAGNARIWGGEVEATLRPFAGFELHAGYGRVDSLIKKITYGDTTYYDVNAPGIRPWNVSLNATYKHSVGNDLTASYRLDWVHQPKNLDTLVTPDEPADPTDTYPAFSLLNASIGLSSDKWDVSLYATNILNETYWLSNTTNTATPWHGGYAFYTPRTVGIRLNYRFGEK